MPHCTSEEQDYEGVNDQLLLFYPKWGCADDASICPAITALQRATALVKQPARVLTCAVPMFRIQSWNIGTYPIPRGSRP